MVGVSQVRKMYPSTAWDVLAVSHPDCYDTDLASVKIVSIFFTSEHLLKLVRILSNLRVKRVSPHALPPIPTSLSHLFLIFHKSHFMHISSVFSDMLILSPLVYNLSHFIRTLFLLPTYFHQYQVPTVS